MALPRVAPAAPPHRSTAPPATLPVSRVAPPTLGGWRGASPVRASPPGLGGIEGGPSPGGPLPRAEVEAVAVDLARAATRLVVTADELVTASAEARPALRATLYRWQTVLALGARRLMGSAPDTAHGGREPPAGSP